MTRAVSFLLLLAGTSLMCGCGGSTTPTTPSTSTSNNTNTTVQTRKSEYAGIVATADVKVTARITVSATLPTTKGKSVYALTSATTGPSILAASGASTKGDPEVYPCTAVLTLPNGTTIPMAGYYDTANDQLILSGGGWLITSTPDALFATFDGKVKTPEGTFGEINVGLRASTNDPQLYCGTFKKTKGGGGWFTLTTFDGLVAGIGSDGQGTVGLSGTFSNGGVANFTWVPEPNYLGRGVGGLNGSTTTMNGTWSLKNTITGVFEEDGTWTAILNSCR